MDLRHSTSSTTGTHNLWVPMAATLLVICLTAPAVLAFSPEEAVAAPPSATTTEEVTEATESTVVQEGSSDLTSRWSGILGGDAVSPTTTGAASVYRDRQPASGARELAEQFFFRLSVDYTRNWVDFTGNPTLTFLEDFGEPFVLTPDGNVSFPSAFEENDHRLYTRLTFGTRGYGSDRLNTYVSLLSYNDLDGTSEGSPFIGFTDSYDGESRFSVTNAYFDVNGLSNDGFLSDVRLRIGRQYSHGFTNQIYPLGAVAMDGINFEYRNSRYNFGAMVGSRSSIFASPEDRLLVGANFGAALGPRAYFNYDVLYYSSSAIHNFTIEPTFESPLRIQGFFRMVDEHPIDIGLRTGYAGDKWGINATISDRLTDEDFIYDIFTDAPADNAFNQRRRLFLGHTEPSFRFTVDAYRNLTSWLAVGGRFWTFQLHDDDEQSAFETSFQDWSGNVTLTPGDHWEILGEYRYRDLDRNTVGQEVLFDDIEFAGETNYQEVVGSLGYRFSHRVRATIGTYYRIFDLQNRLTLIEDSKTNGLFANLWLRLSQNFDFRLVYGSDNDYAVFNPDINRQHGLRIGIDFHK